MTTIGSVGLLGEGFSGQFSCPASPAAWAPVKMIVRRDVVRARGFAASFADV